jgi:hypothetical protein
MTTENQQLFCILLSSDIHKREEVAGGWRRLHNEELHNLYTSQNITGVIKSRRMRWTGHLACMGEMESAYSI